VALDSFGNIISRVIVQNKEYSTSLLLDMIGDRFGESGALWELTKVFGPTNILLRGKKGCKIKKDKSKGIKFFILVQRKLRGFK